MITDPLRFWKLFIATLLGAFLLYLPVLAPAIALAGKLPKKEGIGVSLEANFLPFLALYWGATVAVAIAALPGKKLFLMEWILRSGVFTAAGALIECLALPVLARGWEGFLIWFSLSLWVMIVVLVVLAFFTGIIWGLLTGFIWNLLKTRRKPA